MPICPSVCLPVSLFSPRLLVRRLVDQPVGVELRFTDILLIRKPAHHRQVFLKIFSVGKLCFRAAYSSHTRPNSDTRMICDTFGYLFGDHINRVSSNLV